MDHTGIRLAVHETWAVDEDGQATERAGQNLVGYTGYGRSFGDWDAVQQFLASAPPPPSDGDLDADIAEHSAASESLA